MADLFVDAPPSGLERRLGLLKPDAHNIHHRAMMVVLIGWAPLLLLTAGQSLLSGLDDLRALLADVTVHARFLIAAPVLVLAEAQCAPRLAGTVHHFIEAEMVPGADLKRFQSALSSTRHLLESPLSEVMVVALAAFIVLMAHLSYPATWFGSWHLSPNLYYSPAGWWHTLVSQPLLFTLLLGWIWRLLLWTRLLSKLSRLDLILVASHPDKTAGLGFVSQSLRAFALPALALSSIAASRSAELVLAGKGLPTPNFQFNIGLVVVLVALLSAPMLVFSPLLSRVRLRGLLDYGLLAERLGNAFQREWLGPGRNVDRAALEKPDFSSTTDLYSIVANVHDMRVVPIDRDDILALAVPIIVPFVPVLFLALPLDVILSGLKGLLL